MKKIKFLVSSFILFLSFSFLFAIVVKAQSDQTEENNIVGYVTRCLNIVCKNTECNEDDLNAFPEDNWGHVVRVKGEGFPENTKVYIVGCVTSENGYVCTTGDSNLNAKVRGLGFDVVDNPQISGNPYKFKSKKNPVDSGADGKVEVVVDSMTKSTEEHRFFGVYSVSDRGNPRGETVQYGRLVFTQDPKECASVRWDPSGRVFDAKSLEPLPDVTVKILDKDGNLLAPKPGFNPIKETGPDGIFSFFVPAGVYKIQPEKEGYSFPVEESEIDPNFRKIYSCDSDSVGPGAEIYNQQYEIDEKEGRIVRCDVPVMPLNEPYRGDVVVFDYGHVVLPSGKVRYSARFSHPLAIGILKREDNGRIVAEAQADKNGAWEVELAKEKVPQNTALILEAKKVNLSNLSRRGVLDRIFSFVKSFFISSARATNGFYRTRIKFEPILPYIEGYVYDDKGYVIPNAKVKIVSRSTGNVLLQVRTDENGFIKILPEYLPKFPYYLQVEDGGKIYAYTTSKFVDLNKDYLAKEKLNLSKIEKEGKPLVFTAQEKSMAISKYAVERPRASQYAQEKLTSSASPSSQNKSVGENREENKKVAKQFIWGMIGLSLILLLTTAAGIIFYLRSRQFNS